jgi:hypothetical protein
MRGRWGKAFLITGLIVATLPALPRGAAATSTAGTIRVAQPNVDGAPSEEVAALVARYAPIVAVVSQKRACGRGEPYRPTAVEAVLGQSDVVLRVPASGTVIKAPSARDLAAAPADSNLDLPGRTLRPGCTYEKRFQRATTAPAVTYARLARDAEHPDLVVLQYWFFWVYNDWNDLHEGDWEMFQIVFAADERGSPQGAPLEMIAAQLEGGEVRDWEEAERVGNRPVVYASEGSHALYYSADRWFGRSSSTGFGCDSTRKPSTRLEPDVVVLPESIDPTGRFAWLLFAGRWGEKQPTFNNGPEGPMAKTQWEHPIPWRDDSGRPSSISLPGDGSQAVDAFCSLVGSVSKAFNQFLDRPLLVVLVILLALAALGGLAWRTPWRPIVVEPLLARRKGGQILRSAWVLCRRRWRHFIPVSVLVLVAGGLAFAFQKLILLLPLLRDIGWLTDDSGWSAPVALAAGAVVALPTAAFTLATGIAASQHLAEPPSWRGVLRGARSGRVLPTAIVLIVALFVVPALVPLTIPVAFYLNARWSLAPVAALESPSVVEAFHEASRLTRGHRWRTGTLALVAGLLTVGLGPFLGTILLVLTGSSFLVVDVVSAVVTAVLVPWYSMVLVMQHGDLVERSRTALVVQDEAQQHLV